MKEIGSRFDGTNMIRIVEMTQFELESVRDFLEKVPEIKSDFDKWFGRFKDEVQALNLDIQLSNTITRGAWRANIEPCKSAFSDEDGNLLEFNQWREILLSRSPVTKREFVRNFPRIGGLSHLGQRGIEQLVVALKEGKAK